MSETYAITLEITRFDPETHLSWVQTYQVEAGGILRFVDVFRKINDDQDATLAWSSSCEHAQCGSCAIMVNGKPLLACELLVRDAVEQFNTSSFTVKPITIAPVLRDLVVDLEKAYDRAPSGPSFEKRNREVLDNAELKKGLKLFWFSTGRQDSLIQTSQTTVEMFRKHGFDVVFKESDGAHTWINWRNYLNEFAPQLFQ